MLIGLEFLSSVLGIGEDPAVLASCDSELMARWDDVKKDMIAKR
jgi:hypothetical protein